MSRKAFAGVIIHLPVEAGLIGLASKRRTGLSELDIVLKFFSTVEARARMAASRPPIAMARRPS
jgi:hypothetical protein